MGRATEGVALLGEAALTFAVLEAGAYADATKREAGRIWEEMRCIRGPPRQGTITEDQTPANRFDAPLSSLHYLKGNPS
jgi:hypothetical protein